MTRKSKLVLKTAYIDEGVQHFEIVKTVNTLQHGVPGDLLTRKEINSIMKNSTEIRRGDFVVEFIKGD